MIKNSIAKYCEVDQPQLLSVTGVSKKMEGWRDIVHDKCLVNELTEMHIENGDALDGKTLSGSDSDYYVYANYLPPGLHKFLIYCP